MAKKSKDSEMTFEQAMERLEAIVAAMERGDQGLDRMIAEFEEGTALVKFCTGRLNEIERRIEILIKKGGETVAVPFEADGEPTPEVEENDRDVGDRERPV